MNSPGQYLSFTVADQEYAVEILRVREITQFERLTRVPSAPPYVRGVMNLRGAVVPVVDLAVKFGLPGSRVTKLSCVVIVDVTLGTERTRMGILADAVSQVIELGPGDIEPPPPFGTRERPEYLVGMGKVGRDFVVILDVNKALSIDDLPAALGVEDEDVPVGAREDGPPEPGATEPARAEGATP